MHRFLKILSLVLLPVTAVLFYFVLREWNFSFDAHGLYVSSDGLVHRESANEARFLLFLLSVALLSVTAYFSFRKIKA